jgi:hypothetical protein
MTSCTAYPDEYEVLLPYGGYFKIDKVENGKYIKCYENDEKSGKKYEVYYKMKAYYATFVSPDKVFENMNWKKIGDYIKNIYKGEVVMQRPAQSLKNPTEMYKISKDEADLYANVVQVVEENRDELNEKERNEQLQKINSFFKI